MNDWLEGKIEKEKDGDKREAHIVYRDDMYQAIKDAYATTEREQVLQTRAELRNLSSEKNRQRWIRDPKALVSEVEHLFLKVNRLGIQYTDEEKAQFVTDALPERFTQILRRTMGSNYDDYQAIIDEIADEIVKGGSGCFKGSRTVVEANYTGPGDVVSRRKKPKRAKSNPGQFNFPRQQGQQGQGKRTDRKRVSKSNVNDFRKRTSSVSNACNKCGKDRSHAVCPAQGKECRKCHKMNHFACVCRSNAKANLTKQVKSSEKCKSSSLCIA